MQSLVGSMDLYIRICNPPSPRKRGGHKINARQIIQKENLGKKDRRKSLEPSDEQVSPVMRYSTCYNDGSMDSHTLDDTYGILKRQQRQRDLSLQARKG